MWTWEGPAPRKGGTVVKAFIQPGEGVGARKGMLPEIGPNLKEEIQFTHLSRVQIGMERPVKQEGTRLC